MRRAEMVFPREEPANYLSNDKQSALKSGTNTITWTEHDFVPVRVSVCVCVCV